MPSLGRQDGPVNASTCFTSCRRGRVTAPIQHHYRWEVAFRGPFAEVEVPDRSLASFVLSRAGELRDKPALVDGPTGRTLTYAQLAEAAAAMAIGLSARGFGRGDTFATFAPNMPEYAAAFHGVLIAGGANTTIDSLSPVGDVRKQLKTTGARFVLTVPQLLDRMLPAAQEAGVNEVFVLGKTTQGATPFASLLSTGTEAREVVLDAATALAALPMTSGTTGVPKGVMLTHRNLVANVLQAQAVLDLREDDVILGVIPFFHIYGLSVILNLALYAGATVITMPQFELGAFSSAIQHHRVTFAPLVTPMVVGLAKHPGVDRFDLSSLRMVMSAGAPLEVAMAEAALARLGCPVLQAYGLSEASPLVSAPGRNLEDARPGSVGRIVPSTEVRIVDVATGEDLGPEQDGEILVRGPQVMKGYLNDPRATAAALETDGWLHTGDIGHADGDGYLYVVDRRNELIRHREFHVSPAELEAVLVGHPAVADAAVIPVPDLVSGEVPKAFVVTRGEAEVTEEELMSWVSERVPSYKKVRQVEFVRKIPRSASGKILRRVLGGSRR